MYGLFLTPFLNNFFRTVRIIFGYPPPIIFGYCQLNFWFRDALRDLDVFFPKHENMEESVRTRIAQIAPNLIQEIDRIAQIVRTNDPSFSSARLSIILHTNRVDSADAEKDFRESTVRISDCRASSIFESRF